MNLLKKFFSYTTQRSAVIKSWKIGLLFRVSQIIILGYIIGWELIYSKGYQSFDFVSGIVTTKVKGKGYVEVKNNETKNRTNLNRTAPDYYKKLFELDQTTNYVVYDTVDYVIPPNEYESLFVMTNFLETQQKLGYCDNNELTWCPLEKSVTLSEIELHSHLVRNVRDFTLFIKNDVEFKKFNVKQRNILDNFTNEIISKCLHDDINDPYCPVFRLGEILDKAESNETERYKMLLLGAVIQIEIEWNCNFDFNTMCLPKYSFNRFDSQFKTETASQGFNFRYANKYRTNDTEHRILYKAFGLRFIVSVSGIAGKFDIVSLMLKIGAGFGLMSISVMIADCVVFHFSKYKKRYKKFIILDFVEKLSEIPNQ